MKYAVVGPKDSVIDVSKFLNERGVDTLEIIYSKKEDCNFLIPQIKERVGVWFFCGQIPYHYCLSQRLVSKDVSVYPKFYGGSFWESLVQIFLIEDKIFKKVSLDTLFPEEVLKGVVNKATPKLDITYYPYDTFKTNDELINFHTKSYLDGKSEIAITTVKHVQLELEKRGIPSFKLNPSNISIMSAYNESLVIINRLKNMQVSISIELLDLDSIYSLEFKRMKLILDKLIYDLAIRFDGEVIESNYVTSILTTSESVKDEINKQFAIDFINLVYQYSQLRINFSVAFNKKLSSASLLSKRNLDLNGNENEESLLDYNLLVTFKEANSKQITSSPQLININKIKLMMNFNDTHYLTSKLLAGWLDCTERNARNIIKKFLEEGHIVEDQNIPIKTVGRPIKTYILKEKI